MGIAGAQMTNAMKSLRKKKTVKVYKPEAFEVAVGDLARELGIGVEYVLTKVGLEMHDEIVEKTPVDTGRAQASWNFTVDSVREESKPPGKYPSAKSDAKKGRDAESKKVTPASTVYITNNLPYILPLEHGHSGQAPNGMVSTTVARFQEFVKDAVEK